MTEDILSVKNEVVVITGAAGNLGNEYCNLFLENGSYVIGIDLYKNEKIDKLYRKNKNNFRFLDIDITKSIDIKSKLNEIFEIPVNSLSEKN